MSEDKFTEVTSKSWFSRIGGAIKGVFSGIIFIAIATGVLFWNEGRSVKKYTALKEGSGAVISVSPEQVDAVNEGKLVHVTGSAETKNTLTDPMFGVSAANVLKLMRVVEMYQWTEEKDSSTKKHTGGSSETATTYTYEKTWSKRLIDSSSFKKTDGHNNPASMRYSTNIVRAPDVSLGAFDLSDSLISSIESFQQLPITEKLQFREQLDVPIHMHNGGYYFGADPASPQVGDMRIRFEVVRPTDVSIIAQQLGSTFGPYATKAGRNIQILQTGVHAADAMIQKEQADNRKVTWIVRFVGFLFIFVGFSAIFKPLSVVADVLPILGNIAETGIGMVSFLLALVLSLMTISVAWITYRPLLGITLLVAVAGLSSLTVVKLRSAKVAA